MEVGVTPPKIFNQTALQATGILCLPLSLQGHEQEPGYLDTERSAGAGAILALSRALAWDGQEVAGPLWGPLPTDAAAD